MSFSPYIHPETRARASKIVDYGWRLCEFFHPYILHIEFHNGFSGILYHVVLSTIRKIRTGISPHSQVEDLVISMNQDFIANL